MRYDVCIINEKKSQFDNYKKALGGQTGTLKSGPLSGKSYVLCHASGHLYNLSDSGSQVDKSLEWKYGMPWTLDNNALPWHKDDLKWRLSKSKGKTDLINNIVSCIDNSDNVVIASDSDLSFEGDLLVMEIIIANKLNMKKRFWRSLHKDESMKEINKAITNLVDFGTDLTKRPEYITSNFRRQYDYLLGLQETRLFTKLSGDNLLKHGRLKSHILKICYDQQQLIDNYVEIPYFEAKFKDENGVLYSEANGQRYDDESKVPIGNYHPSEVILDSVDKKLQIPPKFKNLAQIASALASKYSGKQVESTYQKMYEDSVLSYPRTDSVYITNEDWNTYSAIADDVANVIGIDPRVLTHKSPRATHIKDGLSHSANHPISANFSLSDLENKYGKCGRDIYEYVAKETLAAFCADYEYDLEKGHLKDYPTFHGSKQKPTKLGWREIFSDDDELDTAVGLGKNAEPFKFRGTNPKPEALTLKWIIKHLVKHDIGTGATQLSTCNQLSDENESTHPLEINRGKVTLTSYGLLSGKLLEGTKIADMDFTKNFYSKRNDVFQDATKASGYLDEIEDIIRFDIAKVQENLSKINLVDYTGSAEGVPIGECPCCQKYGRNGKVYHKTTKFGRQIFICENNNQDNPSSCKFALYNPHKYFNDKIALSASKVKTLLEGGVISAKLKAQSGKSYAFDMKLVVNDAGYPQFEKVGFTQQKKKN